MVIFFQKIVELWNTVTNKIPLSDEFHRKFGWGIETKQNYWGFGFDFELNLVNNLLVNHIVLTYKRLILTLCESWIEDISSYEMDLMLFYFHAMVY